MKKLFTKKRKKATTTKTKLLIPTALAASAALAVYAWYHKDSLKAQAASWKNERIKNAFFDTLTQKDVAWG